MSIKKDIWMLCDECYDSLCYGADTVKETRKLARADGWRRIAGEDLCPRCAEAAVRL